MEWMIGVWVCAAVWTTAMAQNNVLEMEEKAKNKLFTSAKLKCLVCQNMVDEFEWAFSQTDPKKVVDVGSNRILPSGDTDKKLVRKSKEDGEGGSKYLLSR